MSGVQSGKFSSFTSTHRLFVILKSSFTLSGWRRPSHSNKSLTLLWKSLQQEQPKVGFWVFIDDAFVSQCWPSLWVCGSSFCTLSRTFGTRWRLFGRLCRLKRRQSPSLRKNHYDWLFSWANPFTRNGKRKDASQDFNYRKTKHHSPFKSDILLMRSFKPVLVRRVQIWHTYTALSWQQCICTHPELEGTSWLVVSC